MIIICKGVKHGSTVVKCSFLHDGNWGDEELVKHQIFHETPSGESFWLGFDVSLPLGRFSDRDGKQT